MPVELTERMDMFRLVMKGTNSTNPQCIALDGEIGSCVRCSIYQSRSSVCREFPYSWENNIHNPRCDAARAAWNLPPLEPFRIGQPDAPWPKAA